MSEITAIDAGPGKSAMVMLLNGRPVAKQIWPNEEILNLLQTVQVKGTLALEWVSCYGMAVGAETFDTCLWVGRFMQAWKRDDPHRPVRLIKRPEIKLHLCGTMRAKDPNVRQALLDKFGGKYRALGKKKAPGPLYGFASHTWAALAVAMYAYEVPELTVS
jgi:hypothetical protein